MELEEQLEWLRDPAKLATAYITKRDERLAADKVAAQLKAEEQQFEALLEHWFLDNDLKAVGSDAGTVTQQTKQKPICADWSALYGYILQENAFELLHKRLTEGAATERLESGILIPGVQVISVTSLTISNRKKQRG